MSKAEERELKRSIEQRQFQRTYYFHGATDLLKEERIRELVAAAVDPATRDFNFDQVRGAEVSAEALESLLNTPPMMADRRVAVVREVQALRKDARQVLDQYLSAQSSQLLLILVDGAQEKEDAQISARASTFEFAELTPSRLLRWVPHYANTSLGTTILDDATELLISVVGSDLQQLAGELEKLSNYTAGAPIDRDAVSAVVGVRHGEKFEDLLDAVAERDAAKALELAPFIMQQPKMTLVMPVLMALSTQMLGIAWGHASRERGLPQHALKDEYFNLLKELRPFTKRPWGEAVNLWSRVLPRWDSVSIAHALDALLQADRAAKETKFSSEEQVLSNLILMICGTPDRRAA